MRITRHHRRFFGFSLKQIRLLQGCMQMILLLSLKCCSGPKHHIYTAKTTQQLLSKITVLDAQDKTTTKEMTCMTVWFFHTSCKRCCFHLPRDANPLFWWRSVTATHRILRIFCGSATFVELAIPKQWWKWPRSQCLVTPKRSPEHVSPWLPGLKPCEPWRGRDDRQMSWSYDGGLCNPNWQMFSLGCSETKKKWSKILVVAQRDDLWHTSFFRSKFISSFTDVSFLINLSHNMKANSVSECRDKIGCVVKTNVLCHL